jgi:hypothetical protein
LAGDIGERLFDGLTVGEAVHVLGLLLVGTLAGVEDPERCRRLVARVRKTIDLACEAGGDA